MLTQAHTHASTTIPQGQQRPALLPTFPQNLVASLTPRQLRASLAGQAYYQTHQQGTQATHAQLCAFLKRKGKQWQRARTSTEWQIYFIGGWHAALLADPTAEKRPATQAGPQGDNESWDVPIKAGGEDDDENNRFPGEPKGPIFGGDDFAMPLSALARPIFAPDDETEEHHPHQGAPASRSRDNSLQSRPPRQAQTVTAGHPSRQGEPTAPIAARATFGRDDDEEHHPTKRAGEPLDTPIKAGEPTAPIRSSITLAPEDPTVDSPIKSQARLLLIDDDDEDRYPSFGDETELGGWYRSRLPGSTQRGGGASLLTTPSSYPMFPLPTYPAGSTAVIPVAQHYQQLQEALRWQ